MAKIKICANIKDSGRYYLLSSSNEEKRDEGYKDYIPDFIPQSEGGDRLILEIDTKTGLITNWVPSEEGVIEQWFEK